MHSKRFVGEFVDGNTRKIVIQKPKNLKKGQHVSVYIPTDKEIRNPDTNRVIGYKNKFVQVAPIEQENNSYFVTITATGKVERITDSIRKIRKIKKGDVIIKVTD